MLNRFLLLAVPVVFVVGCGVKGAPLPPLTPAPLGRGEPTYSEATQKSKTKKRVYKDQDAEDSTKESGDL